MTPWNVCDMRCVANWNQTSYTSIPWWTGSKKSANMVRLVSQLIIDASAPHTVPNSLTCWLLQDNVWIFWATIFYNNVHTDVRNSFNRKHYFLSCSLMLVHLVKRIVMQLQFFNQLNIIRRHTQIFSPKFDVNWWVKC